MKIFFSAGEPSGDLHGANLIQAIRRQRARFEPIGFGGPRMAAAGCRLHEDLTRLAVMWFARAIWYLPWFVGLVVRADRVFRRERPDAVILIDYPGFNWWIARRAKKHGIPVFYYGPPQIWAWASWRIGKMRRYVDHILCKLPFEQQWYAQQGCRATYVGHPYFDELAQRTIDIDFVRRTTRPGPLVTILPGSRTQELTNNLKWLLKAATLVHDQVPNVRFAMACFRPEHTKIASALSSQYRVPLEIHSERTAELIQQARCCMAVSGSVSLELLYHTKPTVVLYWITRFAFRVQQFFRNVKYITLVNLLACEDLYPKNLDLFDPHAPDAEQVLMPEYLTYEDRSRDVADHVIQWLTDPGVYARSVARLAEMRARVATPGASERAARYVVRQLDEPTAPDRSVAERDRSHDVASGTASGVRRKRVG